MADLYRIREVQGASNSSEALKRLHLLAIAVLLVVSAAGFASGGQRVRAQVSVASPEVRTAARKLMHAFVDTAGAQTLDSLANRAIAFAGMVPNLYVVLDGKRFNAGQALLDSGLTIIKSNSNDADAMAIRNSVYILMEIAEGRATRVRAK